MGTSTSLTDYNGKAYQFFLNLPFGETMAQQLGSNYFNSPYKFNGKELDEETGFYYYGARYYDPKISIWMSVDPLAEHSPNKTPYHYCSNNPVNRTDPTGMCDDPDCTHGAVKRGWDAVGRFFGAWGHSDKSATATQNSRVTAGPIPELDPQSPEEQERYAQDIRNLSEVFSYEKLVEALEIIITLETLGMGRGSGAATSTVSTKTPRKPLKTNRPATASSTNNSPDFIVTANGEAIPIPNGAVGPTSPMRGSGMVYQGGSGGKGMSENTTGVRIMDANSNQGARVNYMNNATPTAQTVNPQTGRVISNKDPAGHLKLK